MKLKILFAIALSVLVSVSVLGWYQYLQNIEMMKNNMAGLGKTTLQLIQPLAESGINGANKMVLDSKASKSLYGSNTDLLFLKLEGMSEGSDATSFSEAIPPQKMVYEFLGEKGQKQGQKADSFQFPTKEEAVRIDEVHKILYITIPLKIKNGGVIQGAFDASELDNIGPAVVKKILFGASLAMGICMVGGIIMALFLARQFINLEEFKVLVEQVKRSSDDVANGAEKLATTSQQLKSITTEQRESVSRTSTAAEEVNQLVKVNSEGAAASNQLASRMQEVSGRGNSSIMEIVEAMAFIQTNNDKIKHLATDINNIAEKVAVIDDITFKTSLLAFNASIEAERAGEHGRGFAVVAQEMSNLSSLTAKAALEIRQIVQENLRNAQDLSEDNQLKVNKGTQLVRQCAEIFKEISESSTSVYESNNRIFEGSQKQMTEINRLSSEVKGIDKMSTESFEISETTAELGDSLSSHSENLKTQVNDLVGLIKS